ncbi:MAG: hypothetical protein ACO3JL_01365 [Myxococcota bacterium]
MGADGKLTGKDLKKVRKGITRDNSVSQGEIAALKAYETSKQGKKLDAKSKQALQGELTRLIERRETQPEVDRQQILKDLTAGNIKPLVADHANHVDLDVGEPRPFTLSRGTDTNYKSLDGRETPAHVHHMSIDGRSIDIVEQQPPHPSNLTVGEIAETLARVKPDMLQNVERVSLLNDRAPGSNTFMWVSPSQKQGTVEVLPLVGSTVDPGPDLAAHSMNHEIGHLRSIATQPNLASSAEWARYERAIQQDQRGISEYAKTNAREDFAEFSSLYELFRGTPEEAGLRNLYPNRFAAAGPWLAS